MPYLYRHIRLDKNQPFYIGIGSDTTFKRAYSKQKRNNYWYSIINNTKYEVEILLDNLTIQEAIIKEKEFINLYGRKNNNTGILSNMTDGGEGGLGVIFTDERRKKISIKNLNNKYNLGKNHSEITKQILSLKTKSYININNPRIGKNHNKESKEKIAISKNCEPFLVFKNDKFIGKYYAQSICAKELNINRCAINMCLKGKRNKTENYTFIYEI
jgi:hypothetical protein